MADCTAYELILHGLLDGELDARNAADCEAHLASCQRCAALYENHRAQRTRLRTASLRDRAPPRLRQKIRRLLLADRVYGALQSAAGLLAHRGIAAAAFALVLITAGLQVLPSLKTNELAAVVANDHIDAINRTSPVTLASTNPDDIRTWIAAHAAAPTPAPVLDRFGYLLEGARLARINNRAVAVLVYRRDKTPISLFIWDADSAPESGGGAISHSGLTLLHRTHSGREYWCAAKLSIDELKRFQRALVESGAT